MEDAFCGATAFRYYRTPPQVLLQYPCLPASVDRATRIVLHEHPLVEDVLGLPLNRLVFTQNERTNAQLLLSHLWTGELPAGAIIEEPVIGTVTSPLFTLFTLARAFEPIELALAMHEMCGEFAVFEPPRELESAIAPSLYGWQRVRDGSGNLTSLWMRPAPVQLEELIPFGESLRGRRGYRTFLAAAKMVQGVTRSPYEVQAAMLLGLPRRSGGYGFNVQTNKTIPLSKASKKLAQRDYCVADIYIESAATGRAIDIECQGAAIHSSLGASASDADRTTALQAEGVSVALLSYAQLVDPARMRLFCEYVARELREKLVPKTDRMEAAEQDLRRKILRDWRSVCS